MQVEASTFLYSFSQIVPNFSQNKWIGVSWLSDFPKVGFHNFDRNRDDDISEYITWVGLTMLLCHGIGRCASLACDLFTHHRNHHAGFALLYSPHLYPPTFPVPCLHHTY